MKNNIKLDAPASDPSDTGKVVADKTLRVVQCLSLAMALFTSSISVGISVFAGLQRADSVEEQVWSVATSVVAVLCMHLPLMLCRFVSRGARCALVALWLLATVVVLRGQLDVLASANMHAADKRAQTVPLVAVPSVATETVGRGLTAITKDIAKVSIDLAHVEARRCVSECRDVRIRKVELSAELAALDAEATEAKRRATEQDWLRDQASRAEALRESRRANPATSMFAYWLGTTETRLDMLLNFVCVLVLEGAACAAWYFAIPKPVQPVVCDRNTTALQREAVASIPEATPVSRAGLSVTHVATVAEDEILENDAGRSSVVSDDDLLVEKIREAVVAGRLRRNLVSIRKFLGCAQSEAIRLNRLYVARFGKAGSPRPAPIS
ncbi:hypothetical protein X961_2978 [Burkholderia pseudomallei MSHR5613]|uniref:hypothetical protein n=1 Tax=Burkholderia pseudomallei TaxID=28450 RepID=UPI00053218B1|nr:hypothetical protein [Burkholderia pseudomallei]KGS49955.1 hypothetical protein X961_2978 [Burkholderia pseudomallei MSHR5613]